MLLNQTAEYALRAMAALVSESGGAPLRTKDLADRTRIPTPYLSKIMRRLVLHDLVLSQRGHGGGFQLARDPGKIRFLDVLEAVDYRAEKNRCAFGLGRCNANNPCALHPAWVQLSESFERWARTNTLRETVGRGVPPPPTLQGA